MKPRHWIACYVIAIVVAWLMGKLWITMAVWQINRYFDDLHAQLQTMQSNIVQQIRNQPPVVLPPYSWQTNNIVITNTPVGNVTLTIPTQRPD